MYFYHFSPVVRFFCLMFMFVCLPHAGCLYAQNRDLTEDPSPVEGPIFVEFPTDVVEFCRDDSVRVTLRLKDNATIDQPITVSLAQIKLVGSFDYGFLEVIIPANENSTDFFVHSKIRPGNGDEGIILIDEITPAFISAGEMNQIKILNNVIPIAAASIPKTICDGDKVKLLLSHKWENSKPEIGLSTSGDPGIISFTAINNTADPIDAIITIHPATKYGCAGDLGYYPITVYPKPLKPVISAGSAESFCEGDSLILTSTSAKNYQWYVGDEGRETPITSATGQKLTVRTSGRYVLKVKDNQCWSDFSDAIDVKVFPIPPKPAVKDYEYCIGAKAEPLEAQALAPYTIMWYKKVNDELIRIGSEAPVPSTQLPINTTYSARQTIRIRL